MLRLQINKNFIIVFLVILSTPVLTGCDPNPREENIIANVFRLPSEELIPHSKPEKHDIYITLLKNINDERLNTTNQVFEAADMLNKVSLEAAEQKNRELFASGIVFIKSTTTALRVIQERNRLVLERLSGFSSGETLRTNDGESIGRYFYSYRYLETLPQFSISIIITSLSLKEG